MLLFFLSCQFTGIIGGTKWSEYLHQGPFMKPHLNPLLLNFYLDLGISHTQYSTHVFFFFNKAPHVNPRKVFLDGRSLKRWTLTWEIKGSLTVKVGLQDKCIYNWAEWDILIICFSKNILWMKSTFSWLFKEWSLATAPISFTSIQITSYTSQGPLHSKVETSQYYRSTVPTMSKHLNRKKPSTEPDSGWGAIISHIIKLGLNPNVRTTHCGGFRGSLPVSTTAQVHNASSPHGASGWMLIPGVYGA